MRPVPGDSVTFKVELDQVRLIGATVVLIESPKALVVVGEVGASLLGESCSPLVISEEDENFVVVTWVITGSLVPLREGSTPLEPRMAIGGMVKTVARAYQRSGTVINESTAEDVSPSASPELLEIKERQDRMEKKFGKALDRVAQLLIDQQSSTKSRARKDRAAVPSGQTFVDPEGTPADPLAGSRGWHPQDTLQAHAALWRSGVSGPKAVPPGRSGSSQDHRAAGMSVPNIQQTLSDSSDDSSDNSDDSVKPVINAQGNIDPSAQVNLEVLKQLKKMQRKGRKSGSGSSDSGSVRSGGGRGFKSLRKLRKKWSRYPGSILNGNRMRTMEVLGVRDPRQYWSHTDLTRRLTGAFAHMRGLRRVHYALGEILDLHDETRPVHAAAYVAQLRKALHQAALDRGQWHYAVHLLPTTDPLLRQQFGGTEKELEAIHAYEKNLSDLKKGHVADPSREEEGEEGGGEQKEYWKGWNKSGKNKKKKKEDPKK